MVGGGGGGSPDMLHFEDMKSNHKTDGVAMMNFDFRSVIPLSTSDCRHASKLASCSSGDFPYKRMLSVLIYNQEDPSMLTLFDHGQFYWLGILQRI